MRSLRSSIFLLSFGKYEWIFVMNRVHLGSNVLPIIYIFFCFERNYVSLVQFSMICNTITGMDELSPERNERFEM